MTAALTKTDIQGRLDSSERGLTLIRYAGNTSDKSVWRCSKEHQWKASAGSILHARSGCPECAAFRIPVKNSLSIEKVRHRLRSDGRGITCIEYGGSLRAPATFRCRNGHQWSAKSANPVVSGINGCPYCAGLRRLTAEELRRRLNADGRGIQCIKFGGNASSSAQFRCDRGHVWRTTPSDVLRGRGCRKCADIENTEKRRWREADVHRALSKDGRGIRCVRYGGALTKEATFQCPEGHVWKVAANRVVNGKTGCAHCAGVARLSVAEIHRRLRADGRGIKLLKYGGLVTSRSTLRCENGHKFSTVVSSILTQKTGCPACASHGFNPTQPAVGYLLLGDRDGRINVGITRDFNTRLKMHSAADLQKYKVLRKVRFRKGADARKVELAVLGEIGRRGYRPIKGTAEEFAMPEKVALGIFDRCLESR